MLQAFEVDKDNPYYMDKDGILYTKDGKVLVSIPRGKTFKNDTFIMPDTSTVEEYKTKESNNDYMSINGVLYSKDGLDLVAVPEKYCQILDITEEVTTWDEETIWTDLSEFKDMIYHRISEVHIPASMMKIDEKQIKALNYMADAYETKIQVDSENQMWKIDEAGHLARK